MFRLRQTGLLARGCVNAEQRYRGNPSQKYPRDFIDDPCLSYLCHGIRSRVT